MSKKTILVAGSLIAFIVIAGILYSVERFLQNKIQPLQTETQNILNEISPQAISFYFEPSTLTIAPNEEATILLRASYTPAGTDTTLEYLKTEINIPTDYVMVPEDYYVVTEESQFNTIVRVDGPEIINETGKLNIELTTNSLTPGPATSQDSTIARITIKALQNTQEPVKIAINPQNSQIRNNNSQTLEVIDSDSLTLDIINN